MNNGNIHRSTLMGAIIGAAPHLVPWFEQILVKQEYTVEELNTLMRYQIIQLSNDTMAVRDWLCSSGDINLWIHYFCLHVIPFISDCLRGSYISPSNFIELMAV
jgi:hypothetical protein